MTNSTLPPIQDYTLIEKLGEGTSGEVWKTEKKGEHYAIKLFKPGFNCIFY